MARSEHIAANGGLVSVEADDAYDLSKSWFSYVQFRPTFGLVANDVPPFGANTGPKESVEVGAASISASLRSEYGSGGGTIATFDGFDGGNAVTLTAWIGSKHATWGFHYRPDDTEAAISEYYAKIRMTDSELGLTVTADSYEPTGVRSAKQIPDVGEIVVYPGSEASGLIPTWQGTQTAAGEMWKRETHTEEWEDVVVLASDSAIVTVSPDPTSGGSQEERNDRMASFASSISAVSWGR